MDEKLLQNMETGSEGAPAAQTPPQQQQQQQVLEAEALQEAARQAAVVAVAYQSPQQQRGPPHLRSDPAILQQSSAAAASSSAATAALIPSGQQRRRVVSRNNSGCEVPFIPASVDSAFAKFKQLSTRRAATSRAAAGGSPGGTGCVRPSSSSQPELSGGQKSSSPFSGHAPTHDQRASAFHPQSSSSGLVVSGRHMDRFHSIVERARAGPAVISVVGHNFPAPVIVPTGPEGLQGTSSSSAPLSAPPVGGSSCKHFLEDLPILDLSPVAPLTPETGPSKRTSPEFRQEVPPPVQCPVLGCLPVHRPDDDDGRAEAQKAPSGGLLEGDPGLGLIQQRQTEGHVELAAAGSSLLDARSAVRSGEVMRPGSFGGGVHFIDPQQWALEGDSRQQPGTRKNSGFFQPIKHLSGKRYYVVFPIDSVTRTAFLTKF